MTDIAELPLDELVNDLTSILSTQHSFSSYPELISSETQRNPYSFTTRLEYSGDDGSRCYYVKIPIIDDNNRDIVYSRLEAEFENMRLFKDAFENQPNLSVATPIAYFQRYPALVTEEVRGETLHDILVRQTRLIGIRRTNYDIRNLCRLSGRWLEHFQTATARPRSAVDVNELQDYCGIRLDSMLQAPNCPINGDFKSRFLSHLEDVGRAVLPDGNKVSLRHNDYAPHNIIADRESINVLDFTMCDEGATSYDIAAFWERLESFKADPLHSSRLLGELQAAFLDGFDRPIDMSSPALRLGRCKYHLTQLASNFDRRSMNPYQRWRDHRNLQRTLRWLVDEIE